MNTEQEVKNYMLRQLQEGEYIDPLTGEVMLTQLAEAAAWEYDIDLDDELPFELAYEAAARWEGMQAADSLRGGKGRRGQDVTSGSAAGGGAASAFLRPSSRAACPPSAVQ